MKFTVFLFLSLNLLLLRILFLNPTLQAQDLSVAVDSRDTKQYLILGYSTNQYPIECYRFGGGHRHITLIGGIHGGYEWNTILLAYAMIDHFSDTPRDVPDSLTLHIIPCANPDGLAAVIGRSGRFSTKDIPKNTESGRVNGKGVDLNRNWDCRWDSAAVWRKKKVSGGSVPFSETETSLLKTFLLLLRPHCVVSWHSQYPGVFPGKCGSDDEISLPLAKMYSKASGYPYKINFEDYPVTGDASNWLSGQGIPAIHVELTNHHQIEFRRNLETVLVIMKSIAEMK